MNKKLWLSLILYFLATNFASAADLPSNPWQQLDSHKEATTIQPKLMQQDKLSSNPWNNSQTKGKNSEGHRLVLSKQHDTASYNTDTIIINQRRNAGAVGKIRGYNIQTLPAGSTAKKDSSMFDELLDTGSSSSSSLSSANLTPEMPDLSMDFNIDKEYEKLKRQGSNKLHSITSPITGTFHKWWDAVKQTGNDLLK